MEYANMHPDHDAPRVPQHIVREAIAWRIRLEAQGSHADMLSACQRWRDEDPRHELAWQRLAQLDQPFQALGARAPALTHATLARTDADRQRISRRRALGVMASSVLGLSCAGLLLHEQGVIARLNADYATRVGERSQITLEDNSQLWLNTDTSLRLQFTPQARRLLLTRGEIHLSSTPAPHALTVAVPQALFAAQGARFLVRRDDDHALLQVQEGQVLIQPRHARNSLQAQAGELYRVTGQGALRLDNPPFDYSAWIDGVLSARNMPLPALLDEVSRYRPGIVRCDPRLNDFLASGVYQLHDTDLILQTLAHSAGARLRYRTRWWAELVPQGQA